jgi:hypothetical protein
MSKKALLQRFIRILLSCGAVYLVSVCLCCSSLTFAQSGEIHPTLILRSDEAPALRTKLGGSAIGGEVGRAFAATLRGEADPEAANFIRAELADSNHRNLPDAMLVYDLQYHYLSASDRSDFRTQFLNDAQSVFDLATNDPPWYLRRRHVNNWTYGYGGSPLQRLLYPALMFTDDSRAAQFRQKALELYDWVQEGGPNNGIWDPEQNEFNPYPTTVDMFDESIGSPNGYGLWSEDGLSEIAYIIDRKVPGYNPFEKFNRMYESTARFRTYNIGYLEGINFSEYGWSSLVSYAGGTGHGTFRHLGYHSNHYMLFFAWVYNNPVFAWHFYANPSPTKDMDDQNYLASWNTPKSYYQSWKDLLVWGEVAPQDPVSAGWPLTGYWPNAGSALIRKSWEKKGPGSGVIFLWSGPGGSKDRVSFGSVLYHADDHQILATGPYAGSGGSSPEFFKGDPRVNNTLLIDDQGQRWFNNIEMQRLRHGSTSRLGDDTFLMNMVPPNQSDALSMYAHLPFGVSWTRKVHYDRAKDLLWIKDVAAVDDGQIHQLRFNWISEAAVRNARTYDMPGGYVMVSEGNHPLTASMRTYDESITEYSDPDYVYRAIWAGADAAALRVRWVIGKNESAAREFLQKNQGVFVSNVRFSRQADGIHIYWDTDELSQGRVEFGTSSGLGQVVPEAQSAYPGHEVVIPGSSTAKYYFKIIAADSHGDETIADNDGSLYSMFGTPGTPAAPRGLRLK